MGLKYKLKANNQPMQTVVNVSVYLSLGGNVMGPYNLPMLSDMYKNGELPAETLCNFGTGAWQRLYDLPLMNLIRENCSLRKAEPVESLASEAGAASAKVDNADKISVKEQPKDFQVPKTDDYIDDDSPVITCPHCWNEFRLSQVNYISNHPELIGDSVLGETAQVRFHPTKFNAQGYAIDARGMVCRDMACPRCHLKVPEIVIERKGDVLSIVGAPASGKSYYITAMTNMLRKNLPELFGYSFSDADVAMNHTLIQYEDILFHNNSDMAVSLPKTELEGASFTSQVKLQGFTVNLPLPYIFAIRKLYDDSSDGNVRNVVMYDNAGEHFEAGRDSVTNLATMHLIKSSLIMFLFDPFKDSKAVKDCKADDPQANVALRTINQEQILREMINRIKIFRGMGVNEKSDTILAVVVPKYDAWADTYPFDMREVPFTHFNPSTLEYSLDFTYIKIVSYCTRQWLLTRAPDIVIDSEAFFKNVYFIPVSALGNTPNYDPTRNMIGIKPSQIKPLWVDVPIYLYLWQSGLVHGTKQSKINEEYIDVQGVFKGGVFTFMDSKSGHLQMIPPLYWGEYVYDMNLGKYLRFPEKPAGMAEKEKKESANEDTFWE